MTAGVTTWQQLGRIDGSVLLVLNSSASDISSLDAIMDKLRAHVAPSGLYAVAESSWEPALSAAGVAGDHVLLSRDAEDRGLELNYFLESPEMLRWVASNGFGVIVGSAPHSVYNDDVKDVLERRLCLLLGAGYFLAHTLPLPYIYVFSAPDLVRRLGRPVSVRAYQSACRAMVDEWDRLWKERGKPARSDESQSADVDDVLQTHYDALVSRSSGTGSAELGVDAGIREFVDFTRALQLRLADLHAERTEAAKVLNQMLVEQSQAVQRRDEMLADLHAERSEAVALRDDIIARLRSEMDFLTRGWRRWVVRRRR